MIKLIILYVYILFGSAILFGNIYSSIIDSWIWGSHMPESIEAARNYFKRKTPAAFFKIFGTATHLVGFLSVIAFWKSDPTVRYLLITSFILFIVVDVFTIYYFIPRNDVMFQQALNVETISKAWQQWDKMNWVRSFIALVGVISVCVALHKTYYLTK